MRSLTLFVFAYISPALSAQDPADFITNNSREPGLMKGTLLMDITNAVTLNEQHNIESQHRVIGISGGKEEELNIGTFDASTNRSTNLAHKTFVFLDDFVKKFKITAKKGDSLVVRSIVKIDGVTTFKDVTILTQKEK